MSQNPYSLLFGKEPQQTISRAAQMNEIIDSFQADIPSQQIYMITGVRGCGKTVFMTEIAKTLSQDDKWIIVELNSSQDLLSDLAAALASENHLAQLFQKSSINLSFFGIGLEVKGSVPITNIQVAITKMAKMTKGYSFAFQVLGYFTWKENGDYKAALPDYQQYLKDYVYEKIWSELSSGDRKLAYGIAKSETGKASEIKAELSIKNNEYTPYRDRLIKRGIIDGREHGHLKFILPLFEQYVLNNYY
ncbi:MAG: AAA family ATPase [Pseudobutyrivibrio sp.]|nr:AAA family ATPase [Pseudobutyrivibrio sp.]